MKDTPRPILRPIDLNQNPARRGGNYKSPLQWPAEFLSPAERKREVRVMAWYYVVLAVVLQLAAGTLPGLSHYRGPMMMAGVAIALFTFLRKPPFFQACLAFSPFCLLSPWYTEFLALRLMISVFSALFAAYQFRQHLIGLVTAAPLPAADAQEYIESGTLPDGAKQVSFGEGMIEGFGLALSSWFTYLGNEQRLPTVYKTPAGFWYSRTFLTALGVFGMVFLLPHEFILIALGSFLSLLHPILILLVFPLVLIGPVVAMTLLAFVFTADRLQSALSLKRYATLQNTFSGLIKDLAPKGSTR